MRKQIGESGIGGRNESWYYVEKDSEGHFFYIHEWNNMDYQLRIDSGETKTPLADAVGRSFYDQALKLSENWDAV